MAEHVCPWWIGYLLVSPLRRWRMQPEKLLSSYLREGMVVLEPGPGMGFFTLPLARMVGPSGRVIAIDIQQKMLNGLRRRAEKAGLLDRIEMRLAQSDSLGLGDLTNSVDFVLAFAMVHELPSAEPFFREIAAALKPEGQVLFVEPSGHVKEKEFTEEIEAAKAAGLIATAGPKIRHNQSAVLTKRG